MKFLVWEENHEKLGEVSNRTSTNKFEEVIAFYEKGLGLKRIGNFTIMKVMMGSCLGSQMKSII